MVHLPENCALRQVNYLNNLVGQDHRFIKRRTKPEMGFFSFETAWRILQGDEIMNMMRKGQAQGVDNANMRGQLEFSGLQPANLNAQCYWAAPIYVSGRGNRRSLHVSSDS